MPRKIAQHRGKAEVASMNAAAVRTLAALKTGSLFHAPITPYGLRSGSPCLWHDKTIITAALRATGLIAGSVLDGATNGLCFRAYVTDTLAPVLKSDDTAILNDLNAHKVAG